MKKLIAISVVFALVAGAAFAVDIGATVIGTVDVLKGDTGKNPAGDSNKVTSGAELNRVRIDGSGEANENFGGYFRYDSGAYYGNVWWKPIDQFKLLVGSNGWDGFIGKEGNTGWMFYQSDSDTGVTFQGANVWGDSIYGYGFTTRNAFFEGHGDGGNAAYVFITPMDMLGINIILPFFNGGETVDVFMKAIAQVDLKFDFGNIAFTYVGGLGNKDSVTPKAYWDKGKETSAKEGWIISLKDAAGNTVSPGNANGTEIATVSWGETDAAKPAKGEWKTAGGKDSTSDPSSFYVYYGGSFGDLSIDFGLGYTLASKFGGASYNNPVYVGLGVKYALDTFGIKFRTVVGIPLEDDLGIHALVDVLPYFVINDNLAAYVSVGLGILLPADDEDTILGWSFNPYLRVGEEWGAKFLAGIKVWSDGIEQGDGSKIVNWGVPIALVVSF